MKSRKLRKQITDTGRKRRGAIGRDRIRKTADRKKRKTEKSVLHQDYKLTQSDSVIRFSGNA